MVKTRKMLSVLLLSLFVSPLFPSAAYAKGSGAVSTEALNFREEGTLQAPILDVIPADSAVQVLDTTEKWAQVEYEGKIGWVSSTFLETSQKAAPAKAAVTSSGKSDAKALSASKAQEAADSKFVLKKALDSYGTAGDAQAGKNSVGRYAAGTYFVYKSSGKMLNLSREKDKPGAWVNPGQVSGKAADNEAESVKDHPDTIQSLVSVNFRRGAGKDYAILKTIPAGAKAVLTGKEGNWLKIKYEGQTGYTDQDMWKVPGKVLGKFSDSEKDATSSLNSSGSGASEGSSASNASVPGKGKNLKVYLDPGHMGVGQGAVSTVTGKVVDENTINYEVAQLTRNILEKRGYTVYISKDSLNDAVELIDRTQEANRLKADIFVSIHCNSFTDSSPRGTIGFWAGEKLNPSSREWQEQSKRLSQHLARQVGKVIGNHSDVKDTSYGFSFHINRESNMPSTLLELGFISNDHDAKILDSSAKQKEIARGIADGIDDYFGK